MISEFDLFLYIRFPQYLTRNKYFFIEKNALKFKDELRFLVDCFKGLLTAIDNDLEEKIYKKIKKAQLKSNK